MGARAAVHTLGTDLRNPGVPAHPCVGQGCTVRSWATVRSNAGTARQLHKKTTAPVGSESGKLSDVIDDRRQAGSTLCGVWSPAATPSDLRQREKNMNPTRLVPSVPSPRLVTTADTQIHALLTYVNPFAGVTA